MDVIYRTALVILVAASCSLSAKASEDLITVDDLASFPKPVPDARIFYGDEWIQFGDLRMPDGEGPHPVVVFIHGGCWLAEFNIDHSNKLTDALAANGVATWSLEYRRVGNPGGGWPGTFQDIANGIDHLRSMAEPYALDLDRVIFVGHSAGGHLALWAAARDELPASSPIGASNPLAPIGVLGLAPAADLSFLHQKGVCNNVIDGLMGGSPAEYPERYRQASPMSVAPGVPQRLIAGEHDKSWTPVALRYYEKAKHRGDDVTVINAPESGHFEMIDPDSSTWPMVLKTVKELLGIDVE